MTTDLKQLTKAQASYLTKLMRKNSPVGLYGAEYRIVRAVPEFVRDVGTYGQMISLEGLKALREYRLRRWGKQGCMASLGDLNEVEAALAIAKAGA